MVLSGQHVTRITRLDQGKVPSITHGSLTWITIDPERALMPSIGANRTPGSSLCGEEGEGDELTSFALVETEEGGGGGKAPSAAKR